MTPELTESGEYIRIMVNGEAKTIASMSVRDYLRSIECDPVPIAVELNLSILRKKEYETTFLANGDQLEIVWFVGGG